MGFLSGNKVLEEVTSPINGKIRVVKSLGLGTYIQVEAITQSGGIVREIWKGTIREVSKFKENVNDCLILGLGGGTVVAEIKKRWPKARMVGVDSDPEMIELGQKYLGLSGVETKVVDAEEYSIQTYNEGDRYDLILIDIYLGRVYPPQFERDDFLIRIRGLLAKGGVAIFNRLYYDEKRSEAMKFASKLETVFPKVKYFHPEANIMFICSS